MFLSHQNIATYIDSGQITIGPTFDKKDIRPAGVRIHLGTTILIPEPNQVVDLTEATHLKYTEIDLSQQEFYLEPGGFVLGSTFETFHTAPNILTILDGRSTVARLGLTTHITAAIIDGTFELPHAATLELKNLGNFRIRLKFKDPIGMMLFAELKDAVTQKLQSQYRSTPDKVAPPNLNFKTGQDE